jgi:DNA-binding transcriptional regulator YiaG
MSDVAGVLKAEISRISRKEAKSATGAIGKSHRELKKTVADLKRRVASLEKENKRLLARKRKEQTESSQTPPKESRRVRFTSKIIRGLRSRLGLSQTDFGKLLGTTAHSVYLWERKEGPLRLRDKTKAALLSIRRMGAREAKEKLAEAETKSKRTRPSSPKTKKST